MSVQTFNPSAINQSETNWAVASRLVGPFAPHAQNTPNMTIVIDQGFILNGSVLTEKNTQIIGPFTAPSTDFRIDRVVIDRSTGVASIVSGTVGSLTPPALPAGSFPCAQVFIRSTSSVIDNSMLSDERAPYDSSTNNAGLIVCRATLNGVDQTGIVTNVVTKVNLSATNFNVGSGFDTTNHYFKPNVSGYYSVQAQVSMALTSGALLASYVYKNGASASVGCNGVAIATDCYALCADIIYLNGTTDYLELWTAHTRASNGTVRGNGLFTYFAASLLR